MDEAVDRYNDQAMELSKDQEKQVIASVKKRMGKSTAYTNYSKQQASKPVQSYNGSQPMIKPATQPTIAPPKKASKGFLDEVKTATQQSKVDTQVKDILSNLK